MNVISFKRIREYFEKETNSKTALQDWYRRTKKADWDNYSDLINTFNSADNVGNSRYVFNAKGNHYRVVVIVRFRIKRVFIRWIGNHSEYNKIKNINKL